MIEFRLKTKEGIEKSLYLNYNDDHSAVNILKTDKSIIASLVIENCTDDYGNIVDNQHLLSFNINSDCASIDNNLVHVIEP